MNGYVKLDRGILEWEWWHDIKTFRLFMYFLVAAEWRDCTYKGEEIKRGSLLSTLPKIASETGLSIKEVRTALNHLKRTGEVAVKTTNKYSVITVNNYNTYQSEGSQIGRQRAGKGQTKGRQRANLPIKEEYKNIRIQEERAREEEKFSYSAHSNVQNLEHVISNHIHVDSEYIQADEELYRCLREWMEYKDGKQPKTQHHYGTEIGIKKLITSFYKAYTEYGITKVAQVVDYSIGNNYSGVIWNRLKEQKNNSSYMDAVRDRVSMVDNWV